MPWSCIVFEDGFESADCRWVRTVFQQIYLHAPDHEFDALALYRSVEPVNSVTLYLSPRANARLRAAMSRFLLMDCQRPDALDVEVVLGHPMAADPSWCELSPLERLAEAEEAYAHIELVARVDRQVS
jgi:hypothetical protein